MSDDYIGQIRASNEYNLALDIKDEEHRTKIERHLADLGKTEPFLAVRGAEFRVELEFGGAEWVSVVSLLLLPREGYRVHVITGPPPSA